MAWVGLAATTINDYVRRETLATVMRKKIFLKALQDAGRISYDGCGPNHTWPFRFRRTQLNPVSDGDTNTFSQINKRKQANIPVRGYTAAQSLNKFNKVQNQGDAALVKMWANIIDELIDDVRYYFNAKLLTIDGNAAGYTKEVHGLASLFNNSGSLMANNKTYTPNGTYAGVAQTLGTFGGTNTGGNWPEGQADPQYDAWSNIIASATSTTGWASATHTFAANSIEQIRYLIVNTQRDGYSPDMVLLAKDYYLSHLTNLDSKERGVVTKGTNPGGDTGYGYGSEVHQDNTPIRWDYDMPASTGYCLCLEELELKSWQKQLFVANTDWDVETNSDRALLDFYGNLICEVPRCQSKIMN